MLCTRLELLEIPVTTLMESDSIVKRQKLNRKAFAMRRKLAARLVM
jgi:hypothetical protein